MRTRQHLPNEYIKAGVCMLLGALLTVGMLLAGCVCAPATYPTEFPSPGPSPEDMAWDGSHLWVVDSETDLLYRIDLATGRPVQKLRISVGQPRGLTWDGSNLWLLDEQAGVILRLDPEKGEEVGSIKAPSLDVECPWSTTGLAWDGNYLWTAISAEWCSSLNRIDPASGTVIMSFFPQCDPHGITSDGKYLWTIAYNGQELPSKLDRRRLSTDPMVMSQSQEFLFNIDVADPAGLTFGANVLWAFDRAEKRIFQLSGK